MADTLTRKEWIVVDHFVLDKYIEEHLGRPWSIQQNQFYGNDTIHILPLYPDPEATAQVEEWLASAPSQCPGRIHQLNYGESVPIYTHTILSELCNRELLEPGDLKVYIYW